MKTEFQFIPEGCLGDQENITYLVPAFYQTTVLIVPIYSDTNTLTGKFLTKETNELNCEIEKRNVGQVIKN